MKRYLLISLLFFMPMLGFSQNGSAIASSQKIALDIHPNRRISRPVLSDNHHPMHDRFRGRFGHRGYKNLSPHAKRKINRFGRRRAFRAHRRRM